MPVHPKAQPFSFPGQGSGCLLVHGFTGSPPELLPLGEYLAGCGCAVEAPLLAGHGTDIKDLSRTSWRDWLDSAKSGLKRLKSQPLERVFLIGLSMGGLLCLYLAQQECCRKQPAAGVVTLNSPIWLRDQRTRLAFWLRLANRLNRAWFSEVNKHLRPVPREQANALRFAYDTVSPAAVSQLLGLILQVKKVLDRVKCPALVIQSREDETVSPRSAEFIYRRLGSREKRLCWLEKSSHLLTLGPEAMQVFEAVEGFIRRQSERN